MVLVVLRRIAIAAPMLLATRLLPGAWSDPFVYAVLGVLPGLAVADLSLPRAPVSCRLAAGLVAAPMVTALLGVASIRLGLDVRGAAIAIGLIGMVGWTLVAVAVRSPASDGAGAADAIPAAAWTIALGLAVAVALPPLINPYIPVRSDSWTHGAIVLRIIDAGLPPEDPRFAAISVRYVWF